MKSGSISVIARWVVASSLFFLGVEGTDISNEKPLVRKRKAPAGISSSRALQAVNNDICDNAKFIDGATMIIMDGSTENATQNSLSCVGDKTAAYYKFVATGARYKISTCHNGTNFDSALFVGEDDGTSCSRFACSGFENEHDFDCDALGLAATVEFYSRPETVYIIAVAGRSEEAKGNFSMSIEEYLRPDNDLCDDALVVVLEPSYDDTMPLVTGSTENATYKSFGCSTIDRLAVFYKFRGTGGPMKVSTCSNETDYNSALDIFGDNNHCDSLGCADFSNENDSNCVADSGQGSTIEFMSAEDTMYTVAVSGVLSTDSGNFGLAVQYLVRPSNDVCSEPLRIEPASTAVADSATVVLSSKTNSTNTTDGDMTLDDGEMASTKIVARGSTLNSTITSFACGGSYAAVFYSVAGTGQRFRVSTCSPELDFNSVVHVQTGVCDPRPNICSSSIWETILENDFDCDDSGDASTVEWASEAGILYSIAVRGAQEIEKGNFGLSLEAFGEPTTVDETCRWVQVCD